MGKVEHAGVLYGGTCLGTVLGFGGAGWVLWKRMKSGGTS